MLSQGRMKGGFALIGALLVAFVCVCGVFGSGSARADGVPLAPDQVTAGFLSNTHPGFANAGPKGALNGQSHARFGITNIDSLPNFNDHYFAFGFGLSGAPQYEWYTNTVGNPPQIPGTTTINAPVVPVSIDLRNADGSPRFVNGQRLFSAVTPYVNPTLNSPVFGDSAYSSSSTPTQFTDAVQRAEYWGQERSSWHTLLAPSVVKPGSTMTLNAGTYRFALNSDGSCCLFILVDANTFNSKLLPPGLADNSTIVGAAELSGAITTKDMSTFLFPNVYLYFGDPNNCCVLGYHTYDFEPGNKPSTERRYVGNYSSWITPGLFGDSVADVTALSHEIAETYNDPFVASDGVHNITPWWLSPNGNCQDNLETGDVIEGLPNDTYPVTMNGFTYHPQNEALLPYFEFQQPSTAIDHAYSYPNESLLSGPSLPQNPGCQ